MRQLEIVSFTLAIILLFVGKIALNRSETLRKYSIPEPVIGGFLAGIVVAVIYFTLNLEVTFLREVQPFLLLYFFAGIGLKADIRDLLTGGKPLLILTLLAAGYMLMQNFLGMGVAAAFGMDPKAGLMAGSVSLTTSPRASRSAGRIETLRGRMPTSAPAAMSIRSVWSRVGAGSTTVVSPSA